MSSSIGFPGSVRAQLLAKFRAPGLGAPARSRGLAVRTALALALATLALAGLAGCASSSTTAGDKASASGSSAAAGAFPVTFTDDASRSVSTKAAPARIVSLAPAATEIAFELGLGDKVVGVTSYDDYPSQVASISKVGDFAGPNVEAVAAAKPDVILATSGVQADVVKKLESLGATVIVLDPQTLDAVYGEPHELVRVSPAAFPEADLEFYDRVRKDLEGKGYTVK